MADLSTERYINPYTDFGSNRHLEVFEQAEIAQYSLEERREYEVSVKNYWDYFSTMKTAVDKAKAEGEVIANRKNASRMKAKGYAIEDIAEITGPTSEEIAAL